MQACVLPKPGAIETNPLELRDLPEPEPGAGEVLLAVECCGVCHTDLHISEGDLIAPRLPVVPGHQAVGRVIARGPAAQRWQPGDRLGVPWVSRTCGRCSQCAADRENLCEAAQFTGLHGNGGFAERLVVHEDFAIAIPPDLDAEAAAPLLCAGIIGYRALRLAGLRPGERLGLYGFGASAHLAIQIAVHWNCEVFVFTRQPEHRQHALSLGATWVGSSDRDTGDDPPAPLDRAVTFAPVGWLVPRALGHLRRGGSLAINAVHSSPIPAFPYETIYWERSVTSVANATRRDARELMDLAIEIPLRPATVSFPLAQANTALQRLKTSSLNGAAVLTP